MLKLFLHALSCAVLSCLLTGSFAHAQGQNNNASNLIVQVSFDPDLLAEVEVTLLCTTGSPGRHTTRLQAGESFNWQVSELENDNTFCQAHASLPHGFSIVYAASGDATTKSDENGCQYADVRSGQTNRCNMKLTQDHVPLTVYKKWIGATGEEADVEVELECSGYVSRQQQGFINQGLSASWQMDDIPPDGLLCSVSESPDETFISDDSDCRNLLLMPGMGEACTMVNTKIVKRIEMLNRYGKVIMILVMLTAGLIAVRRYV